MYLGRVLISASDPEPSGQAPMTSSGCAQAFPCTVAWVLALASDPSFETRTKSPSFDFFRLRADVSANEDFDKKLLWHSPLGLMDKASDF